MKDLWDINNKENLINESAAILYYYRALALAKLGRLEEAVQSVDISIKIRERVTGLSANEDLISLNYRLVVCLEL